MTVLALQDAMDFRVLWLFHWFEPIAHMSFLTAARFPAFLSAALGFGPFQSVARGWLTAVAAILGKLIFERLNAGFQCPDDFHLCLKQSAHRRFALLIGGGEYRQ